LNEVGKASVVMRMKILVCVHGRGSRRAH